MAEITQNEQAFLDKLKASFETNDQGQQKKMSDLQAGLFKRLTEAAEKPGELSQDAIAKIVIDEARDATNDVRNRKDKGGLGGLLGGVVSAVGGNEAGNAVKEALREREVARIKDELNPEKIGAIAIEAGLSEKTERGAAARAQASAVAAVRTADVEHTVQIGVASPLAARLEAAMAANGVKTNNDGIINPIEAKPIATSIKQMEKDGILPKDGFKLADGKMAFTDPAVQALGIGAPATPPEAVPAKGNTKGK